MWTEKKQKEAIPENKLKKYLLSPLLALNYGLESQTGTIMSFSKKEMTISQTATQFNLSDEMYQVTLQETDAESKIYAIKQLIFKEQFQTILSQLTNTIPINCTLSYNRANSNELPLIRDIKQGLTASKGLIIEDVGEIPIGANKWQIIDKAASQIRESQLIVSIRFPRSESNKDGRQTRDEDFACYERKGRLIPIAIDGELANCFNSSILAQTHGGHTKYLSAASPAQQVEFFANLLHKIGHFATEQGKIALIHSGYELINSIDEQINQQTILEAIERREQENNASPRLK